MKLSEFLVHEAIITDLRAIDRDGAIREIGALKGPLELPQK
jgi:hypothetical protein